MICEHPLYGNMDREKLAQGQDLGHALVTALATLDVDETVASMQRHDPLSWHCPVRCSLPPWKDTSQVVNVLPQPEREPSPSPKRPYDDIMIASGGESLWRSLLVTFDTLEWPPRRKVVLPDPPRAPKEGELAVF